MQLRNLLVAFDGSEASDRALAFAEELAGQYDARMLIVTVLQPFVGPAGELAAAPQTPTKEEREQAEQELDRRVKALRVRGRLVEVQVEVGVPARTLLELADRLHVSAIVAGRSGKGAIARFVLGSVTTSLLHKSTKPIIVVP
ncbi:MAG: universal stress protein [Myxococcaceae bacterium]|nr:MAG: universal stress protein [Myxococcaceae bacterium]